MKKFSKLLALGLALTLTFGMTVSAAEGADSAGEIAAAEESAKKEAEAVSSATEGVNLEAVPATVYLAAQKEVVNQAGNLIAAAAAKMPENKRVKAGTTPVPVLTVDVKVPNATTEQLEKGVAVTLKSNALVTDGSVMYVVLHQNSRTGEWEVLKSSQNGNSITAIFHNFSPTVVVAVATEPDPLSEEVKDNENNNNDPAKSPQTGEALPIAGFMALICLAGVAVCVRKANYNK